MMSKMLVFTAHGGAETQGLVERPAPAPRPNEVAIEVKAAGVDPADWKIGAGQMGSHRQLPAPMGREASGVVTAVGTGVENFAAVGLVEAGHTAGKVIIEP